MANINNNTIFIHVPKTAGISIGRLFLNDPTYRGDHNRLEDKYIESNWNKFMICRNPFDRFISAYEYQKKLAILGVGLKFQQRKYLNQNPNSTFSQFVNFIYKNKRLDELHTRPQKYWIRSIGGIPLKNLKIIRFENLQEELDEYFTQIGIQTFTLGTENKSERKNFFEYYSNPTVISQVQELYHQDFKMFGYSQDINIAANGKS